MFLPPPQGQSPTPAQPDAKPVSAWDNDYPLLNDEVIATMAREAAARLAGYADPNAIPNANANANANPPQPAMPASPPPTRSGVTAPIPRTFAGLRSPGGVVGYRTPMSAYPQPAPPREFDPARPIVQSNGRSTNEQASGYDPASRPVSDDPPVPSPFEPMESQPGAPATPDANANAEDVPPKKKRVLMPPMPAIQPPAPSVPFNPSLYAPLPYPRADNYLPPSAAVYGAQPPAVYGPQNYGPPAYAMPAVSPMPGVAGSPMMMPAPAPAPAPANMLPQGQMSAAPGFAPTYPGATSSADRPNPGYMNNVYPNQTAGAGPGSGSNMMSPNANPAMTGAGAGAPGPGPLTGAGAGAGAGGGSASGSGLSAGAGTAASAFPSIGDQSPFLFAAVRFPPLPNPSPLPGRDPNSPFPPRGTDGQPTQTGELLFRLSSLKISDNQSPRPLDRVYYTFNAFNNFNDDFNRRFGIPIQGIDVMHHVLGLEKTFWNGDASWGLRLPINQVTFQSNVRGLPTSSSSVGNLNLYAKYAVLETPATGDLVSLGISLSMPTGSDKFAGNRAFQGFNTVNFQPFVGYIFNNDRLYLQGFAAFDFPTESQVSTMFFNDMSLGYRLYEAAPGAAPFISAIRPTVELHFNIPLSHRGINPQTLLGTPDVIDLTAGVHIEMFRNSLLSLAYARNLTGPTIFDHEFILMYNFYYGKRKSDSLGRTAPAMTLR